MQLTKFTFLDSKIKFTYNVTSYVILLYAYLDMYNKLVNFYNNYLKSVNLVL